VLELAIARMLYDRFPDFSEGRMAKVRSHVVSRASCAVLSRELGLGERMRTDAGGLQAEEVERLSRNRNVLAALLEAAIAAVYLEHGFEFVEPAIVEAFEPRIEYALTTHVDHKTELQEQLARLGRSVTTPCSTCKARRTTARSRPRRSSTAKSPAPARAARRRTPSRPLPKRR